MKRIIILGAGGNSRVLMDLILAGINCEEQAEIAGFLDDSPEKKEFCGYPVLGPITEIPKYQEREDVFFINGIGDNYIRKAIFERYPDIRYITLIHPSAIIGSDVSIQDGTAVMPGAIINAGSVIGRGVIINTGSIIEHDNNIGDFAHLASGVVTAGAVTIGELTMLGTGSKVIQGIQIGDRVMVGAGAVVISDLPDNCTAVGVPAKIIKKR